MLNTGFPPWPSYTEEEAGAVRQVLLSNKVNYWTGTEGRSFEEEFANWVGTEYAVALANGTVALEAALKSLGVGPGDEVIVASRTFFASASSIASVGAVPVFADVDRESQNITATTIERAYTSRTKAIICVHLAGWPCDMDPIMSLADKYGLYVVEDCAQAHGAHYKGRPLGSIGHVAAWSFCQDKIITTGGEGGMVTTNDKSLWSRIWSYKDHGKSWDAVHECEHPQGFRWLHASFGTNWRMTEMQAAIGRIQLQRMHGWHAQRIENAERIWAAASRLPGLRVPVRPSHIQHAAYKCYIFIELSVLRESWNRDRIMSEIVSRGVPCYSGTCSEVYQEKAFDSTDWRPREPLPVARELGQTSLAFLVHPTLTDENLQKTILVLEEVMLQAAF